MKKGRLFLILPLLFIAMGTAQVFAQKYPAKPVRIIVPYASGGPLDSVSRYVGQKLSERWQQPVITDNRGGSGGAVGAGVVVKAPPDGYTLLLGNGGPVMVYPHERKALRHGAGSALRGERLSRIRYDRLDGHFRDGRHAG